MATEFRDLLEMPLEEMAHGALYPVVVAVIDTGVDATHPDLAGRMDAQYALISSDDLRFETCREMRNADNFGHGTGVAGIIVSIAPNARIIDVRAIDAGHGTARMLVEGLRTAIDTPATLINMSLATRGEFAPSLLPLCEKAYYQNQVIVASQWNMPRGNELGFPAEFASCIGVNAAMMNRQYRLRYHDRSTIEFGSLGKNVLTAAPGGGYTTASGTSFATPQVTGMCALFLGQNPHLTVFELKTLLKQHAVAI